MNHDHAITKEILDAYYENIITEAEMRARMIANHFTNEQIDAILGELTNDILEEE